MMERTKQRGARVLVLNDDGFHARVTSWGMTGLPLVALCVVAMALMACQPTVKIEAPEKPIEINLNVRIEQEVRIKVDRELDDLLASNPDLF